ncbi:site-specific tyrosine recombinase XerD [Thermopolyspora sp. NPDC052614]|uniref:site-specific tyrosine recombinase XerD n=1 Tax=Thermopolyspora sp. NPDC052614 TaxID=3155682 RepID=UPI003439E5F8
MIPCHGHDGRFDALSPHADTDAVLAGYLAHLATERGLAANTLASYRRDLRRYLEHLQGRGRRTIAEVAECDVVAFLDALREGDERHPALGAGSAARAVSAVRGLHRFAVREGVAAHDPAGQVRPPRRLRRLPKAIGVGDVERLIAASGPEGAPLTLRNRALLEVLYGTGARISEAVGLTVEDVDLGGPYEGFPLAGRSAVGGQDGGGASAGREEHAGTAGQGDHAGGDRRAAPGECAACHDLARRGEGEGADPCAACGGGVERVRLRGKGGRTRQVPLGRYAGDALRAYLARARPQIAAHGHGTHALFLNARGGRLTRQGAWEVLQAAAERAGLDGVSPHMLRHSFAAHLLDGGADVRVVQELLGHASVTTTQVYTLVAVDKLRDAYAAAHPRGRP